ncbi:DUF3263 domain-containing protein [Microcella daejeonensis]|uniref:DUF3263 domain-containing protein n=1 Tax=Microcella daejeonensis TaxID=2994971 RepID=UPI0022702B2A|nr:DUF3263 domain-containing protein [Microcella daejeonensis]WAB84945.1 DUF3263 domain-containing protein [Microcella daejeonensis]
MSSERREPQAAAAVGPAPDERLPAVLEFERRWWGAADGRKESRIRAEFGWSAARYYQVLNALLDTDAALRYDPVLVSRLREVRTERAEVRRTRRPGAAGAA